MHACALVVFDGLASGDADRVLLRLDLDTLLVDARQFDDGDEVVAFLEDVDRREGAGTGGAGPQPVAREVCLERALQREQSIERAAEAGNHGILLAHGDQCDQCEALLPELPPARCRRSRQVSIGRPRVRRPACALPVAPVAALSRSRKASRMASTDTGRSLPGGRRSAGAASTAQASDAHDASMALFSFNVRSGSATTSWGEENARAG